jgi:hypothetical protein
MVVSILLAVVVLFLVVLAAVLRVLLLQAHLDAVD